MKKASKTDWLLANSLRDLMEKSSLEKVSIKSITDNCGLNRQTFYYHFRDIYDLVKWMYLADIEQALERTSESESQRHGLQVFLDAIDCDREFHRAIYNSVNYYPHLRREFSEIALKAMAPVFEHRFGDMGYDAGYREFLLRMYILVLFEYIERRALGIAFSTDGDFIEHWMRTLDDQLQGASDRMDQAD